MKLMDIYPKNEKYYPNVIKQINGEFYLYNLITNGIFKINKEVSNIIHYNKNINIEKDKDIKTFLENNYILRNKKNDDKLNSIYDKKLNSKFKFEPSGLTLMVSQECNLRCKYCYGEGGEYNNKGKMTFEIAKKAIDYFVKVSKVDKVGICFFGGEPLTNFVLIKEIIDYTKSIENYINKKFHFSITTNGTLLTNKIKKFLLDNNIFITISLDGTKEVTDSNRYYISKKGVYDVIKSNINKLDKKVVVRATIAPPNYDMKKSINHLVKDLKLNSVAWAVADNLLTEEDFYKISESYNKLLDELWNTIKLKKYNEVKKYSMFMNNLRKFSKDGIRIKCCGAANNMIAIDINGDVYPCHRFVGLKRYVLTNVDSNTKFNEKIFSKMDLKNFDKCKYCIARNICGGACINENVYANLSINKPSEKHCNFTKKMVEKLFEIYISLTEEDKLNLFGDLK